MKNTASITGASSGIGKELARIHAASGGDLVIVARREQALQELKSELETQQGVRVFTVVADLTREQAPQQIYDQVQQWKLEVDILINNAGFGGHGLFHQRDWKQDQAMIQLNVLALSELTHLFVKDMVRRKRGRILNVASIAGFLPGPLQATYYATKAFVLSFSQAIAEELTEQNITVTALCPGPVATEFAAEAGMEGVRAMQKTATAAQVAEIGYRAMMKGKLVVINDWKLSLMLYWVLPVLPRRWTLKLSRRSMEKT